MGNDTEDEVIECLRGLLAHRRVKIRGLASDLQIPYRTLQNYLYKKSRMPIPVYLEICNRVGVPPEYPLTKRARLDPVALKEALLQVLGPVLPSLQLDDDLQLSLGQSAAPGGRPAHSLAGLIAGLIGSQYETWREIELRKPLERDK